ncbi:MAG: LamG domain-containing protein [Alphaproteobacteria bacterium]|nr:LamG domain-containing protein [Alphaproteobacteria bacterium]
MIAMVLVLAACGGRVSDPIFATVERSGVVPGEVIETTGDDGGEDSGTDTDTDGGADSGGPFTGGCLELHGDPDVFTGTDAALPMDGNDRTVEFWFKHENNAGKDVVVAWGASGSVFGVGFYNGFPAGFSGSTAIYGSSGEWADGSWHHLAFVWSDDISEASIWIDGVLDTATTASVATYPGGVFGLGDDPTSPYAGDSYEGVVDELHIWDRALGDGEFGGLYDSAPAGMVAWYDMNREGSGAGLTLDDRAGSNDLTSIGAPAFVPCEY